MRFTFLVPVLPALLLVGCANMKGSWPSLAPRAGEMGQPVAATGSMAAAAPIVASAPEVAAPVPGDVRARLAAVTALVDKVAAAVAPLQAELLAKRRAAAGTAPDSLAQVDVTIAESRLIDSLAPLADTDAEIDAIADLLASLQAVGDAQAAQQDAAALAAGLDSARARVAAVRAGVTGPLPGAPPAPPCLPPACPVPPG